MARNPAISNGYEPIQVQLINDTFINEILVIEAELLIEDLLPIKEIK